MERKVKYTLEFNFRFVGEVIRQHHTIKSVGVANGFAESNLRKWVGFLQEVWR